MRITQAQLMPLFGDMNVVHIACLFFRIRCQAHRLLDFGFEPFINEYDAVELLALAALMPPYQCSVLVKEAYAKGDAAVRAWIKENANEVLIEMAVSNGN